MTNAFKTSFVTRSIAILAIALFASLAQAKDLYQMTGKELSQEAQENAAVKNKINNDPVLWGVF